MCKIPCPWAGIRYWEMQGYQAVEGGAHDAPLRLPHQCALPLRNDNGGLVVRLWVDQGTGRTRIACPYNSKGSIATSVAQTRGIS